MRTSAPESTRDLLSREHFEFEDAKIWESDNSEVLGEAVNMRGVLAEFFGISQNQVPDELMELGKSLELDQSYSYRVICDAGWDASETWITFYNDERIIATLVEWAQSWVARHGDIQLVVS